LVRREKLKMDLTIDVEDYKLNIRAGGVIIHNNKLLVHKSINSDYYGLVGGRVEIGEDSESTVKREMKEELGKDIEITGYVATIENFFEMKGSKYHEILFVHQAEFVDEQDRKIECTLKNVEGKDYLQYEWLELNKIEQYPLLPKSIQKILKENKFPVHKIEKNKKTWKN
jgi:ADP-ribose pyrophosphatase YjhB (NUDIX family)